MEDWQQQNADELLRISKEQKARIAVLEDALDELGTGPNCWCEERRPGSHTDMCFKIRRARGENGNPPASK